MRRGVRFRRWLVAIQLTRSQEEQLDIGYRLTIRLKKLRVQSSVLESEWKRRPTIQCLSDQRSRQQQGRHRSRDGGS